MHLKSDMHAAPLCGSLGNIQPWFTGADAGTVRVRAAALIDICVNSSGLLVSPMHHSFAMHVQVWRIGTLVYPTPALCPSAGQCPCVQHLCQLLFAVMPVTYFHSF